MIYQHEIPKGSRLYFGTTSRLKRDLEYKISQILLDNGFEQITTPNFSYSSFEQIQNNKHTITLFDEQNNQIALRADSTLDVVRIITKRLGRATSHKKWFYIQPVFNYPTKEFYQIGCEWIEWDSISDIINLNAKILKELGIDPIIQISNINIPKLISKELGISLDLFYDGQISQLFDLNIQWLNQLLYVCNKEDLQKVIDIAPKNQIKDELCKLFDVADDIKYSNIIISPLYGGPMKYYDDIYFRVFDNNLTIAKGGKYTSEGISSLGFAYYSDSLIKILEGL